MTLLGTAQATALIGALPNLMWLEPLLRARLAEQMPGLWLGDASSLSDATGRRLEAPGVIVLFSGADIDDQNLYGRDVTMRQRWSLVTVSRAPTEIVPAADARGSAGALSSSLLNAVLGWRSAGTESPFRLVAFPAPVYAGSYLLTPLTFEVSLVFVYNPFEE